MVTLCKWLLIVLSASLVCCASLARHAPLTDSAEAGAASGDVADDVLAASPSVDALRDLLDTIQSELLMACVCRGGERIEVWVRPRSDRERQLEVIYRVPGILHIYRLAYVQRDQTVLLADCLDYGFMDTRYSTHQVEEAELREVGTYPTHISTKLATDLTKRQRQAQKQRERRIEESYHRP